MIVVPRFVVLEVPNGAWTVGCTAGANNELAYVRNRGA
jgi:hypothetical protein